MHEMLEFIDEDGIVWSRHSGPDNDCIEMAELPDGRIGIRDSNNRQAAPLTVTRSDVTAWLAGARKGGFDRFT